MRCRYSLLTFDLIWNDVSVILSSSKNPNIQISHSQIKPWHFEHQIVVGNLNDSDCSGVLHKRQFIYFKTEAQVCSISNHGISATLLFPFPSICVCRSSVVNVNTTHVARAVIAVALVTTSKPGWQEPSTRGISARVRTMCANANYIFRLHIDWCNWPRHYIRTTFAARAQRKWVDIAIKFTSLNWFESMPYLVQDTWSLPLLDAHIWPSRRS